MSTIYHSAVDAEDAYYDAIDECDLDKMMSVWDASADITCLLPMQPMRYGHQAIREAWAAILDPAFRIEININHLQWVEQDDIAIHLVEEIATMTATEKRQPPVYASNIYRRTQDGWRMLMHLNSPAPPTGVLPPLGGS